MLKIYPKEYNVDEATELLAAMANPKRLQILSLLVRQEVPVGQLAKEVGLSQSALSQHLSKLRQAHLVETRREAQNIYYSSRSMEVSRILDVVNGLNKRDEQFGVSGRSTGRM